MKTKRNGRARLLSGLLAVLLTGLLILVFTIWPQEDAHAVPPEKMIGIGFNLEEAVVNGLSSFPVFSSFDVKTIEGAIVIDTSTGNTRVQYEVELRVFAP